MVPRAVLAALLFAAVPLAAHHSLAAEFDGSKPIVLRGKVTKLDWMNPHVYLWVDAVDAHGVVTNWRVESAAPNYLQRLGWSKGSVRAGDTLTIHGYAAKDEPNLAKMDEVTLPDGRRLTVGHAGDGTP
jgi:Family of unknown function (DUF6152)